MGATETKLQWSEEDPLRLVAFIRNDTIGSLKWARELEMDSIQEGGKRVLEESEMAEIVEDYHVALATIPDSFMYTIFARPKNMHFIPAMQERLPLGTQFVIITSDYQGESLAREIRRLRETHNHKL